MDPSADDALEEMRQDALNHSVGAEAEIDTAEAYDSAREGNNEQGQ